MQVTEKDVVNLAGWGQPRASRRSKFPSSRPGSCCRISPACRRSSIWRPCGAPCSGWAAIRRRINPLIPVDLVIDHSVQVDRFGTPDALAENVAHGIPAQPRAVRVFALGAEGVSQFPRRAASVGHRPPGESRVSGEVRFRCGRTTPGPVAFPDTLVGTDSHTTMINGLGVVGWGVGGIEAEAVMLGQPLYHARARGDRLRTSRRTAARRDGHRPGAHA